MERKFCYARCGSGAAIRASACWRRNLAFIRGRRAWLASPHASSYLANVQQPDSFIIHRSASLDLCPHISLVLVPNYIMTIHRLPLKGHFHSTRHRSDLTAILALACLANKPLSVDPWYTRLSRMPSCAYSRRMCHLFPRLNFVTWTREDPFGDYPQRLCLALPSQPNLSTKRSWYNSHFDILCR
jgi:hypothetical protein